MEPPVGEGDPIRVVIGIFQAEVGRCASGPSVGGFHHDNECERIGVAIGIPDPVGHVVGTGRGGRAGQAAHAGGGVEGQARHGWREAVRQRAVASAGLGQRQCRDRRADGVRLIARAAAGGETRRSVGGRFREANVQSVIALDPAAVARDADVIRAGGDVFGNPKVRSRAAVVVPAQFGAVGVLQPPERVGAAGGVRLQRARRVYDDAEIIHVAGGEVALRVRLRLDLGRGGAVVAVVPGYAAARRGAGGGLNDRPRSYAPVLDRATAGTLASVAPAGVFEVRPVVEVDRHDASGGADTAVARQIRRPTPRGQIGQRVADLVGRFHAAGGGFHRDVEVAPVAVAGGVAHAVGHQPGALLRRRAGKFARRRIEAQARYFRREAVPELAVPAARGRQRQRVDCRARREGRIVQSRTQVQRHGSGIQRPPDAAAPVRDRVRGVDATGGVPAGGGRIEVNVHRARLPAVVREREKPRVAAGPLEPVRAFLAHLSAVRQPDGGAKPALSQHSEFHPVQPIPAHDDAVQEPRPERRLVPRRPSRHGGRGQVAPGAAGIDRHVDCVDRAVRLHRQPPVAGPGAQPAREYSAVSGLEMLRGERPRGAVRQRQLHRSPGGGHPGVVAGPDHDPRRPVARVDQPQPALLRGVGGGMENRHVVAVRIRARVSRLQHRVVDRRERAVARAHVGGGHNGNLRIDKQTHIPGEAAEAARQTFGRVAGPKLRGGELHRRPGGQFQRNGPGAGARVVDGDNLNIPGLVRAVDDPQHALRRAAGLRGHEPRNRVPLRLRGDRQRNQGREK